MGDIIKMYKARGYRFVSLKQALASYKKPAATDKKLSLKHQRAWANYYLDSHRGPRTEMQSTKISGLHKKHHYFQSHFTGIDIFHPKVHTR